MTYPELMASSLAVFLLWTGPVHSGSLESDPKGWRDFQWGITKEKAEEFGARPFQDAEGTMRFGLPGVKLLPYKKFWLDLGFYGHTGLSTLMIAREGTDCDKPAYAELLKRLRHKYGEEKESKDLEYPHSYYQSHTWIVGMTKIELHHGCPKPGQPANTQPTTHLRYEKRFTIELWEW